MYTHVYIYTYVYIYIYIFIYSYTYKISFFYRSVFAGLLPCTLVSNIDFFHVYDLLLYDYFERFLFV